jgi:hypothetical protein
VILERASRASLLTRVWHYVHRYLIRDGAHFCDEHDIARWLCEAGFRHAGVHWRIRKCFLEGKAIRELAIIEAERTTTFHNSNEGGLHARNSFIEPG